MLTRLRSALSEEHGVGLVELMVVMTLMTIIGAVVMTSLVGAMKANAKTQTRLDALAELQKSVDRMTGPLRAAAPVNLSLSNASVGDTAVVEVWNSNFTAKDRVTYRYCPTQGRVYMRRVAASTAYTQIPCTGAGARLLMDQVSNALPAQRMFTFKNSVGVEVLPTAADTSVFQIDVKVRRSLQNQPNPIIVDTQVRLRNAR